MDYVTAMDLYYNKNIVFYLKNFIEDKSIMVNFGLQSLDETLTRYFSLLESLV